MHRFEPIRRLAVLNRGEAAVRCLRAVKALRALEASDLVAVAFFTEADRDAPYVRHADLALPLAAPRGDLAAWLDHDALVDALRRAEADAAWPGWGFVAEDAAFVERLEAQGVRFLGPSAAALRALGDKLSAKTLAAEVGVPTLPWRGPFEDPEAAARAAAELDAPLVLKAAAGGGGRGMRLLDDPAELAAAFRSAAAEARAAFGDGRLFLERRVTGGRHVEVQVAADRDGLVRSLGCRDCSVQRRHQKVVEEAPAPGLEPAVRAALEEAAVRLAARAGYTGLGTVEFLVEPERFHFLEVNPRLQVEHGVTEEVTGLDLVQLQIRIARGESLAAVPVTERGHAIEARVCAEDPEAGFAPAPGRIARFDPALGPGVRVDTGIAAGTAVPAAFDSLVAKVIARGASREEARSRLICALDDLDLLVAGGATNKGFLRRILAHPEFRAGGVDTGWLDRLRREPEAEGAGVALALLAAAILRYQRVRAEARLNFFADPSSIEPRRVPPSRGQEIELSWGGESYALRVLAIGAWRYRIQMGGRTVTATLREEGPHRGRLELGQRAHRVLTDADETEVRVELDGRAHRFGVARAGQVRASAPAMVVAVHVVPGDAVRPGQPLGLLEAMKMEIGFEAPMAGNVAEVRVQKGQQVAAGDVLVVIAPSGAAAATPRRPRLELPEEPDPLASLLGDPGTAGGAPDLRDAAAQDPAMRRAAIAAVREEVRRVLLGYDVDPDRASALAAFLEDPLPPGLPDDFLADLAAVRAELPLFADVATLFARWSSASVGGRDGPSNHARLAMAVRRIRAGGAGIAEPFLDLVRRALRHYGVEGLAPSDPLERAVLRLLATQREPELRDRLVLGLLRRTTALSRAGVHLADDRDLPAALDRIATLRGLVSHAVADAASLARYVLFERPRVEREAERTSKAVGVWLDAAASQPTAPPEAVLRHLADAPRGVFLRVGRWLADPDPRRRTIALAASLRRLYSPLVPVAQATAREGPRWILRLELPGARVVLAAAAAPGEAAEVARVLVGAAERERTSHEWPAVHALELFLTGDAADAHAAPGTAEAVVAATADLLPCGRFTVTSVGEAEDRHRTFVPSPRGYREDTALHGLHPAAAERVDLGRLAAFELERLPGADGIVCFAARSRDVPGDERLVVLADVRSRSPDEGREALVHVPAFEHAFHEATRVLRHHLAARDPKRRLQWNRLALHVAPEMFLDPALAEDLGARLAPETRNLGLEKVVVRLRRLDRDAPDAAAREVEVVISDVTGANMTIDWREPRRRPLEPRSEYERRVAEARRRRLVYPYEIVRMLTGSGPGTRGAAALPPGEFEEFDLDPDSAVPRARSVAGRAYGTNVCGVVFGILTTPTEKVPEGMARVLVLSDPTFGMGALAVAECDRLVAALDLAEERGIPVEWVAVSSGARIAMESGTENLDATARVVRRIVELTGRGGSIHVIVPGVNVGAQSYFDALSTMVAHTKGALVMTDGGAMVLTGCAALEASGSVSAEDETAIGGHERVMGPNGEAQYHASDLAHAFRLLYEHHRYTYVVPGEAGPRRLATRDPAERSVLDDPVEGDGGFRTVGEIFDDRTNPGRKRPFPMRAVMQALVDRDGGHLERWRAWAGAGTAIVWDAHLGGWPVCLVGIESQPLPREGYRPPDGPAEWTGGTLFPLSSKKVARALHAASGNRPVVILANLSGFDGSPESMRKLQLEHGAEIARAVVGFQGPILFLVVSRYHGGAYVVFSRALHPRLRAAALAGSYASVIGGSAAAAVVFPREVRARAAADPRVRALRERLRETGSDEVRGLLERTLAEVTLEMQAELAQEFDAVHTVERAREVGSLEAVVAPQRMRLHLVRWLDEELGAGRPAASPLS